ncbi:MAG: DUF4115 domain-containing protein [Actinomycetota bacterium]|nr:DUF4115 domain-containing protein [Actinomycetota bacterium]
MIALILLIVAIVVIGGGIEVVHRMRFGGGAAAAHHRALDTLGQLTNQGADRRVDLAPPAGAPLLDHVRRVVESDPTHPRISPRPMSRPVAIPGAVSIDAPPAAPEPVATRPAPTEIEGVRILLPDLPAPAEELDAVDELGADDTGADRPGADGLFPGADGLSADGLFPGADGLSADDLGAYDAGVDAGADEEDTEAAFTNDGDADRGGFDEGEIGGLGGGDDQDEAEGAANGRVAAAHAVAEVVVRLDDETGGPAPGEAIDPEDDEPEDWDRAPVGAISLADHRADNPNRVDGTPPTARPDELGGPIVGTPVSPPTSVDGAESVRVVRADDGEADWDGDTAHPLDQVEDPAARIEVPPLPRSRALGGAAFAAAPGPADVEGFRILEPSEADGAAAGSGATVAFPPSVGSGSSDPSDTVTDQVAAVTAPPAGTDRSWHHSVEAPAGAGTFHPSAPEQTRAQLAALARSGRVEPIDGGGGGGAHRSHDRRSSRRAGGHTRSTSRPAGHRRLRVATAALAAVVAAVGVVSAVVIGSQSSSDQRAGRAAAPPRAAPTTTTAPPVPASLVSRTASTATYQETGSPTISFVGSGSCWIEIRQGDQSGKILFEGVLSSGSQKSQTGPFWVRLGNPAAISVQINGMVLNQPANAADNPYNLQFQ